MRKIPNPQREELFNKNFKSFLINKNKLTAETGIKNPSGPLVKTAKAEKMKNKNKPIFLPLA
jgi:hypothetical protein